MYDGPNSDATLLQTNTGSSLPATVTSSTHEMYVHFYTDGSITRYGFAASYTTVTPWK